MVWMDGLAFTGVNPRITIDRSLKSTIKKRTEETSLIFKDSTTSISLNKSLTMKSKCTNYKTKSEPIFKTDDIENTCWVIIH